MSDNIKNNSPSICILGAGPSGITAAKNLLQENIENFVVFEKNDRLGGNWIYDEKNQHASVYEATHLISSKRLSEFDDYPIPPDYPDYPSHEQMLKYFEDYSRHFGINSHIQCNTFVEKVTLLPNKRWHIVYRNQSGLQEAEFDYLFVANGHHWDPVIPSYPGQFNGHILHSHAYKNAQPFKGKRVLVVGGGNSACDIAVEIARHASKTCISMRNGQHIFPKFIFGKPTDIAFSFIRWLPIRMQQSIAAVIIRLIQGRYAKYHLETPDSKPLETHPTINSELLYLIRHGKIKPYRGIQRFEGSQVYFTDGTSACFDTIVFATGYKITFPFFDTNFIEYSNLTNIPLYRKMMHPQYDNLFFIGLFQPQGSIWPLADYQARIAARLIAGTLKRPENIEKRIQQEIKERKIYKANTRHALEVDYHRFRRELLKELT